MVNSAAEASDKPKGKTSVYYYETQYGWPSWRMGLVVTSATGSQWWRGHRGNHFGGSLWLRTCRKWPKHVWFKQWLRKEQKRMRASFLAWDIENIKTRSYGHTMKKSPLLKGGKKQPNITRHEGDQENILPKWQSAKNNTWAHQAQLSRLGVVRFKSLSQVT